MLIETMPDVLAWTDETDVLGRVYRAYVNLLSDRLGALLAMVSAQREDLSAETRAHIRAASDDSFLRVLTAPEVSFRLLWSGSGSNEEATEFILRGLRAEAARVGDGMTLDEDTWTALGDRLLRKDGSRFQYPQLPGIMPLDFGSPLAAAVDLGGPGGEPWGDRGQFTPAEVNLVLDRLTSAMDGIRAIDDGLFTFAVQFNKVLILQKDPGDPGTFSSGSTGQYVGRSFLTNPHLPRLRAGICAEAVVHEGIHSLLYMQERQRAWVYSDELYGPAARAISPWTGNDLALRPYLQACFVWYGLVHFWCLALTRAGFPTEEVHSRLATCLRGFLGAPLTLAIQPYREGISPELLEAIERMQERIADTFAAVRL